MASSLGRIVALFLASVTPLLAQESRPSVRLFTATAPEGLLLDRDQDGRPDGSVPLRLVLDGADSVAAAAAAAEFAARLGLEVCAAEGSPVVVMATTGAALSGDGPTAEIVFAIGGSGLKARPDARAVVVGRDAADLLRRARLFAAYWPEEPSEAATASRPAAPRKGKDRRFGLDKLFEPGGLATDEDGDLVPDGTDATLVASGEPGSAQAAVDVAFRIGLECAGLRFPLAQTPAEYPATAVAGPVVLVGDAQPLVADLIARKLLGPPPPAGEGEVVVIDAAFGKHAAIVVRGGDAEGLARAGRLFFARLPHLSDDRLDVPDLSDLATEARRLVAGVSIEGQRARIVRELGIFADEAAGIGACDGLRVLFDAVPGGKTRERLADRYGKSPGAVRIRGGAEKFDVEMVEAAHTVPGPLESFEFTPEPETTRALARVKDALADVRDGARVEIEVRVSEPPGERSGLAGRLRDLVPESSRKDAKIVVRSAWKPAYFHLVEELLPRWKDRGVVKAELAARRHEIEGPGGALSTLEAPTRLLQELYPADDVVARTLDLKVGADVTLKLLPRAAAADYVFTTVGRDGREVVETFDVAFHERPFNAVVAEVERVALWSGLVRVVVDGKTVVRDRQTTDLEELWTSYQENVLPRIRDLILQGTDGRPEPRHAPWFVSLRAYGTVSEPDEDLPFGLGRTSAVDMLHEEIYFHTLGFVQSLGGIYAEKPFEFAGRIVPRMNAGPGAPPRLAIDLSPRVSHAPAIEALRRTADGAGFDRIARRELRPLDVKDPRVTAVRTDATGALTVAVAFRCDVADDDRPAWLARQRPEDADTKVLAVDQGAALVEEAALIRGLGGKRSEWFAYPDVARIDFVFAGGGRTRVATLSLDRGDYAPRTPDPKDAPLSILPDDRPLRPEEAGGVLAVFVDRHPSAGMRVRAAGRTTAGRELWTLESGPFPADIDAASPHFSRRKLAAWKPVYAVSAREHANEVSSTTHVLQWLRDVLEKEPAILRDVRIVVNPVWNADGADLAMDLAEERPADLLHAGYLGSLGENLTVGQDDRDPLYTEAKLRLRLFSDHLPDVFFNPHGYPMHEWVQPFSGYAAWVKKRDPKTRDWWIPRGAFIQTFQYVDDEAEPAYATIAEDVRRRLGRAIDADPAARALNEEQYARYERWSRFLPADLRLPRVENTAVYGPIRGVETKKDAVQFVQRHPKTCLANVILEVPDETASGEHLRTVSAAGRAVSKALVQFLRERAAHPPEKVTPYQDGAMRVRARKRVG